MSSKQVAKSGVVIVGGGLAAANTAETLRSLGYELRITIISEEPTLPYERPPLSKEFLLGRKEIDDAIAHDAAWYQHHNITVVLGERVTGILEKDGQVTGLATSAGDVEADRILIAIGAIPNTELAEAAGLEVDNGVLTDASLRTSDPDILAAGDVANAEHLTLGRLRVEHWDNAIR